MNDEQLIWEAYSKSNYMYHVTPAENIKHILKDGLVPTKGSNSQTYGEEQDNVYLFPTIEDAEDALGNWLGDQYEDEDISFSLLQVDVTGLPLKSETEWEYYTQSVISPDRIKLIKNDF